MNTNISLTSGINWYQSEKFPTHHSRVKTKQNFFFSMSLLLWRSMSAVVWGETKQTHHSGNSFIPCMYHIALWVSFRAGWLIHLDCTPIAVEERQPPTKCQTWGQPLSSHLILSYMGTLRWACRRRTNRQNSVGGPRGTLLTRLQRKN